MNEPRRWTFLCIWYENRGWRVHEVERLCFRSTWPCVYPSFYGSAPPVSTRITVLRVLTSFVPPVHNQGVSSAPLQGHALWNIFLLTTGSFFVISLTDLYVFLGRHLAADVFPAGSHTFQLSCHRWIQLPATSAGGSVQLWQGIACFYRCLLCCLYLWPPDVAQQLLRVIPYTFCEDCIKYP